MRDHEVSIIIPLYNKEKFIKDTLVSVYDQSYQFWHCVIVDDGSTDDSVSIVKEYINDKDGFELIIRSENYKKGASTCRNIGLSQSRSEFVQFLDADDIISKNKIYSQVTFFQNNRGFELCTCKWGNLSSKDSFVMQSLESYNNFEDISLFLNSLIKSKGYFPIHAYLIKRKLVDRSGPWNEEISLNDDGEFIMRVIANTTKIGFCESAVAYYRSTDSNNLSSFDDYYKVKIAINSWKLIDSYLESFLNGGQDNFISWSKQKLYINVKNSFPGLITLEWKFFWRQIILDLTNRLNRKINFLKSDG
jgi:glycosyltransferase involved in cell wall biosynthesis